MSGPFMCDRKPYALPRHHSRKNTIRTRHVPASRPFLNISILSIKKQLQQNVQTMKPFLLTLLFACLSIHGLGDNTDTPKKEFKHPDRISYDGACLKIDGKDRFIYSAAFHYFRCPEELWRDRFRKIKEAGFNTVETYVPWNWHERTMPSSIDDTTHFDFSDL